MITDNCPADCAAHPVPADVGGDGGGELEDEGQAECGAVGDDCHPALPTDATATKYLRSYICQLISIGNTTSQA